MNHLRPGLGKLQFSFITKKSHEEPYKLHATSPIHPEMENIPDLLDLLKRDDHPELDDIRFKLVKWMIAEKGLRDCDLSSIPKRHLVSVLILLYMKENNAISAEEGDVFLLSLLDKRSKDFETELVYTMPLNKRAFILSFMFAKLYSEIRFAFEIVGLIEMTVSKVIFILNDSLFHIFSTFLHYKVAD